MSPNLQPTRYDLLIYNITLAIIAALLMATVGSNLRVVQLLEKTRISGLEIDLAVGVALNVGIVAGAATVAFAMAAALCCIWRNRLEGAGAMAFGVAGWSATTIATGSFILTLVTIPLTLAVEVGL